MDEELTTTETEESEQNGFADYDESRRELGVEPEPEAAPEPKPEVDIEARLKELEKKERALQKGFQEIAEREKRISAPAATPQPDEDPLANLDPEAQKILDAFVERKFGGVTEAIGSMLQDTMESEIEGYAAKKGVEADAVLEVIREKGLQPKGYTSKDRQEVYDIAAAVVKAGQSDDIESRVQAEVDRRLAELAEQGQVVSVTPKPTSVEVSDDGIDPDSMPPGPEKANWLLRKAGLA